MWLTLFSYYLCIYLLTIGAYPYATLSGELVIRSYLSHFSQDAISWRRKHSIYRRSRFSILPQSLPCLRVCIRCLLVSSPSASPLDLHFYRFPTAIMFCVDITSKILHLLMIPRSWGIVLHKFMVLINNFQQSPAPSSNRMQGLHITHPLQIKVNANGRIWISRHGWKKRSQKLVKRGHVHYKEDAEETG